MTPVSTTHWILTALVVALIGALLSWLAAALAPFLAGLVLAYMVTPLMHRLRRWHTGQISASSMNGNPYPTYLDMLRPTQLTGDRGKMRCAPAGEINRTA